MRYVTDVVLDEAIVHILNTDSSDQAVFSERTLPLLQNSDLAEYFRDHIVNSLRDSAATAACFTAFADDNVAGISATLVDGSLDLVSGSRSLAEKLHAITAKDKRIKPGNLAALLYRANNGAAVERYLALMKIDPSTALRPKQKHDQKGKLYIDFELTSDIMPTTRERLQKCAFVQRLQPRPEYDMMLLDRQQGTQEEKPIAKFFSETFLGAELALDARQRTHRFYRAAIVAHNLVKSGLPSEQAEAMRQAIDTAVTSDVINLDAWIAALPLPAPEKELVDQGISQRLPDREFQVDHSFIATLRSKRRFVGDSGLRVEVPADSYHQVIKTVDYIEEPGQPPRWHVVIETEKWEEVLR